MLHFSQPPGSSALSGATEGPSDSLTPVQVSLLRLAQRNLTMWAREDVGEAHSDDVELLLLLKFIEVWEPGFRITQSGIEALRRTDEVTQGNLGITA